MRIKLVGNPLGRVSVKRIKSVIYAAILVVGLAVMISPLPEGTFVLSLILGYFGYKLTGNIYVSIAIYIVTFIITILLIKKLNLIAKFRVELKKIHSKKDKFVD